MYQHNPKNSNFAQKCNYRILSNSPPNGQKRQTDKTGKIDKQTTDKTDKWVV